MTRQSFSKIVLTIIKAIGNAVFLLFWLDDTVRYLGVYQHFITDFFRGETRNLSEEAITSYIDFITFEKAYITFCYIIYTWNLGCSKPGLYFGLVLIAFGLLEVSSAYRTISYTDTIKTLASGTYPQNYEMLCVGMIVFISGLYVSGKQTIFTTLLHGVLLLSYIARVFWATYQN